MELYGWIPGCYGLQRPAAVATADALIYRVDKNGKVWVLTGVRDPKTRWEAGQTMLTFGGFVDTKDGSVLETATRETEEEVPGLPIEVDPRPLIATGPWKYAHLWDPEEQRAVNTGELVQDIPVVTTNYLAECFAPALAVSDEVVRTQWISLDEIMRTKRRYAFDMALVFEKALAYLLEKQRG